MARVRGAGGAVWLEVGYMWGLEVVRKPCQEWATGENEEGL